MTTKQAEQLEDLTTSGQLAIAVSKLIQVNVFTGADFTEAVKNTSPDLFGGSVHFWAMCKMADDSKMIAANAVSEAITDFVTN